MENTKLDLMSDILNKLEDVKNSQVSLIEKIGSIEVDLFNCPDKDLEKSMDEVLNFATEAVNSISKAFDDYSIKINQLKTQG